MTHWEYLDSEECDGSLAGELEEDHQDEDDEERMQDWLLEYVPKPELLIRLFLRDLVIQSHKGMKVILV